MHLKCSAVEALEAHASTVGVVATEHLNALTRMTISSLHNHSPYWLVLIGKWELAIESSLGACWYMFPVSLQCWECTCRELQSFKTSPHIYLHTRLCWWGGTYLARLITFSFDIFVYVHPFLCQQKPPIYLFWGGWWFWLNRKLFVFPG